MSMQALTALQMFGITIAYAVMALALPAALFYRKLKDRTFSIRFMAYLAVGNFFMINLVLILQLLHISNRVTLVLFTVFSFFVAYVLLYRGRPGQKLAEFLESVSRLADGQYGKRLFLRKGLKRLGALMRKLLIAAWRRFWRNKLDFFLTLLTIGAVLYVYGRNIFMQYGYCASDIIVHNYWINAMDMGELFVDGVYPFGFHCVIYYLHQVFGIETFVLLRLFWVIQTLLIHLLLLAFIRMCCKSRYTAYAGVGIYTAVMLFREDSFTRYLSSLPQEFGMAFILPSIAFLFLFFEHKKQELSLGEKDKKLNLDKEGKKRRKDKGHKKEKRKKNKALGFDQDLNQEALWENEPSLGDQEERIYLLDDVLAESAKREASGEVIAPPPQEDASEILTLERNEKDGTFFIKKAPLEYQQNQEYQEYQESQEYQENQEDQESQAKGENEIGIKKPKGRFFRKWADAWRKEFSCVSSQYLALFAIHFSMTFTVHFYNTMIAGIFCLGVAFGYFFRLWRPRYFGRVFCAGVLSLAVSILPMLAAYIGGTPLQGSLMWGVAVMEGTQEDTKTFVPDEEYELTDLRGFLFITGSTVIENGEVISENGKLKGGKVISIGDVTVDQHLIKGGQMLENAKIIIDGEVYHEGIVIAIGKNLKERKSAGSSKKGGEKNSSKDAVQNGNGQEKEKAPSKAALALKKAQGKLERLLNVTKSVMNNYLLCEDADWANPTVLGSLFLLFALAVLYFALRQTDYAARFLSTAGYMALMTAMFVAPSLGLPELMDDKGRTCIYYAYSIIAVWCFCADGILNLIFGWGRKKILLHAASFLLTPAVIGATIVCGMEKDFEFPEAMQSNGAVTCLTNIIRENEDMTWTIVSANDEMRMGEGHGYHYELDQFLRSMERKGGTSSVRIPTKKVYFFVEKTPINYAYEYEDSGQRISPKGAGQALPRNNGLEMYESRNRWIEMSRMYYWARHFSWLYPNEISIYFETDDFICYSVEQNGYNYYNFSIDYHYNMQDYVAGTEE